MVDLAVHVRFEPECPYDLELIVHDDLRNHLFHANTDNHDPTVDGITHMPIGTPWYLTLHGGDGVDFGAPHLGPIQSEGSPVQLDATIDCVADTGRLELVGAVSPPPVAPSPMATIDVSVAPTAHPSATILLAATQPVPSVVPAAVGSSGGADLVMPGLALLVVIGLVCLGFAARRGRGDKSTITT